jgi:hypothetical protein
VFSVSPFSFSNLKRAGPSTWIRTWSSLLLLSSLQVARSYPSQAGWCPGGLPAVAGPHVDQDKSLTTGSIADGDLSVVIDRTTSLEASIGDQSSSAVLQTGRDYEIRIVAGSSRYRGFLIRLEATEASVNTSMALIPRNLSQAAAVCFSPAVGISHYDRDLKNFASGILRLDEPGSVSLDVTVVKENSNLVSSYFYSAYSVRFDDSGGEPTPSLVGTSAPASSSGTTPPSDAPVAGTSVPSVITIAPARSPGSGSESPSELPSDVPSVIPTITPESKSPVVVSISPSEATVAPVKAPSTFSEVPSDVPSERPSDVPSETPSDIPSAIPVPSPTVTTALPTTPVAPDCEAIEGIYAACVSKGFVDGQKTQCESCVATSFPPLGSACEAYSAPVCTSLQSCGCEPCVEALEGYVECQFIRSGFNCDLDCRNASKSPVIAPSVAPGSAPSTSPSVTRAPSKANATTPPASCDQHLAAAQSCFKTNMSVENATECSSCVVSAFSGISPFPNCADAENYTCSALDSCSVCGTCTAEVETYFNCTLAGSGCRIDCSSDSPSPTCDSVLSSAQRCFRTELDPDAAQECGECLSEAFDGLTTFTTCDEAESFSCNALKNCTVCGTCSPAVESFFQCSYAQANCSFSCNPVDDCNSKLDVLSGCLERVVDASACLSCLAGSLGSIPGGDCGAVEEFACQTSMGCEDCQLCAKEVDNWVGCSVTGLTGCNTTCSSR